MAVDLQQLCRVLEASLDPSKNKQGMLSSPFGEQKSSAERCPAEVAILQETKKPNFSLSLLQIAATDAYGGTARLASALYFKNFIKKNWTVRTPPRHLRMA